MGRPRKVDASVNGKSVDAEILNELNEAEKRRATEETAPGIDSRVDENGETVGQKRRGRKPKNRIKFVVPPELVQAAADLPFTAATFVGFKLRRVVPPPPKKTIEIGRHAFGAWVDSLDLEIHPMALYGLAVGAGITAMLIQSQKMTEAQYQSAKEQVQKAAAEAQSKAAAEAVRQATEAQAKYDAAPAVENVGGRGDGTESPSSSPRA